VGESLELIKSQSRAMNELPETCSPFIIAIDAAGNAPSVEYDLLGRRAAMESADTGRREYTTSTTGLTGTRG